MVAELVDDNGQHGVCIVGDVSAIIHLAAADDGAQCVGAVFQFGAAPVVVRTHQQAEHNAEGAAAFRAEIVVEPIVINLLVDGLERLLHLVEQDILLQVPIVEMGFAVKIVQRFQKLLFLLLRPTVERVVAAFQEAVV